MGPEEGHEITGVLEHPSYEDKLRSLEVCARVVPAGPIPLHDHYSRKSHWNQPWGLVHEDKGGNAVCYGVNVILVPEMGRTWAGIL